MNEYNLTKRRTQTNLSTQESWPLARLIKPQPKPSRLLAQSNSVWAKKGILNLPYPSFFSSAFSSPALTSSTLSVLTDSKSSLYVMNTSSLTCRCRHQKRTV